MKLIYLHASHRCVPCQDMEERINKVLQSLPEIDRDAVIEVVDVDAEPEIAALYGVTTVPSFVVRNDSGIVLWQHSGRISKTRFRQVLLQCAADAWETQQFGSDAPSAEVVFYRTYSRRTDDGNRENWAETIDRVGTDIAALGRFTPEQKDLVMEQALLKHTMPSGRWLWVGGTPWVWRQANYSGSYNCTSTNIDSIEALGLLMNLAMQGSGTGAVLEDSMIEGLEPVAVAIKITKTTGFGTGPGDPVTKVEGDEGKGSARLIVGDSRGGWVEAYQYLLDVATDSEIAAQLAENGKDHLNLVVDLTNVRPAGQPLKGFGGVSNPSGLGAMFKKVAGLLNKAVGRQLNAVEVCLLIDAAAACVVAGNIRRSAGMRQFSAANTKAMTAKQNLYVQGKDGKWKVDPEREDLRMANHTRCFHRKPTADEIAQAVTLQFHTGEGAIQYVPEAIARASCDLLQDADDREAFLYSYCEGYGREMLCSLIDVDRPDMGKEEKDEELDHRLQRYGLNPCGEIIGTDFHCNLAEVHLNTLHWQDMDGQERAFRAAALQVCALLHHEFGEDRYAYSRMMDPIVGVSFTGLFDFFVEMFGIEWLDWMMEGRPRHSRGQELEAMEAGYLQHWRKWVEDEVKSYCTEHGLKVPNRCTTVQPAGTKSLLTGASSGWHPPKAQRFIRRITVGREEPVAMAAIDMGYKVIPAQSARDSEGNLLDDIYDGRVEEWLIEIPTEVPWANKPGADAHDLGKLPIEAQWGLYMQVQNVYTAHNTSATLEISEAEVPVLAQLIHDNIQSDGGYISAAILARFDATGGTFPRLPFEPIDEATYRKEVQDVMKRRTAQLGFHEALLERDDGEELEQQTSACSSGACVAAAEKAEQLVH